MEINYRNDPSYRAGTLPRILTVPPMHFITYQGRGAPQQSGKTTQFQQAVQTLYTTLYTIKFWDKKHATPLGYAKFTTTPLECLWWTDDGTPLSHVPPASWHWKLLIRVPDFVTETFLATVLHEITASNPADTYKKVKCEAFNEGLVAQLMHTGPYDHEGPTLQKLHTFIAEKNCKPMGKHHELYFSDPRRTKPDKLRTMLRQPVQKMTN